MGNRVTVERDASGRPEGLVATLSSKSASFERDPVTHFIACVRDMSDHAFKYEQDLEGRLTHAWDREHAGPPCAPSDPLRWTSEYTSMGIQ